MAVVFQKPKALTDAPLHYCPGCTHGIIHRLVAEAIDALGVEGKALIVTAEADAKVIKSAANIPGVKTAAVNTLNVYDILNYDKFIVASDAVAKIEEVYA